MAYKLFSLEEARRLVPTLKQMLGQANAELAEKQLALQAANEAFAESEKAVDEADRKGDVDDLRQARSKFQNNIAELSTAQSAYLDRFNYWVAEIGDTGVILRDIHEGLLDFPSRENGFAYLLCWRMEEDDINYWHLSEDGFAGRKPLATLAEYV